MLETIIICIIVTIIIILSFIFGVKSTYRIKKAKGAADYLDRNSVVYQQRSDTFIRRYVTTVRIRTNTNSGGRR
jgi:hypothetical protein